MKLRFINCWKGNERGSLALIFIRVSYTQVPKREDGWLYKSFSIVVLNIGLQIETGGYA